MGILDEIDTGATAKPEAEPASELVFVGFNSRVAALDRHTGNLVWQWKSPSGSCYTTVLLDGDRLIVSVVGYTYCLDPATGTQLWANELPGMGTGVATLCSARGGFAIAVQSAAADEASRESSAHGTHTATMSH
jgi:outer membrane protein assembly factor BamB